MPALLEMIASYVPALSVRRFAVRPALLTQLKQERFQAALLGSPSPGPGMAE